MQHELATIVGKDQALFNDSAIAHIEHSLGGNEVVLIGVSSHMKTADLEWLVLHCGGTLSKKVTEDTSFVIRGSHVGDTMHKHSGNVEDLQVFKDAEAKGIQMLSTLEFFKLDGWHENIMFSLRDTSAYGLTTRQPHKYSLELAKSNRSRCHGHCKSIIPAGVVRLKACFDPLTDSFVYFRNLKCITPVVLDHIEKEWKTKGYGDSLLDFVQHQPDEVLRMFQVPGAEPSEPFDKETEKEISPDLRLQWAHNLTQYLQKCAFDEARRRREEHEKEEGLVEDSSDVFLPVGQLGKRKRAEMQDFLNNLPPRTVSASSTKSSLSIKTSATTDIPGGISPRNPTQLVL